MSALQTLLRLVDHVGRTDEAQLRQTARHLLCRLWYNNEVATTEQIRILSPLLTLVGEPFTEVLTSPFLLIVNQILTQHALILTAPENPAPDVFVLDPASISMQASGLLMLASRMEPITPAEMKVVLRVRSFVKDADVLRNFDAKYEAVCGHSNLEHTF